MVIDLHLAEGTFWDFPLESQLNILEKEMDKALVMGLSEIIIIHGIGEGILKKAVHKMLKTHPHVGSYVNEYHYLYGFGSTKVTFK